MCDQEMTREQLLAEVQTLRTRLERAEQAEEDVRATREFLTSLLDNVPGPVYVTTADERYRLVNRAWETFVEKRREEVIGQPISQVFPPAVAQQFEAINKEVQREGKPKVALEFVDAPDGRHWFYTVKFPLHDFAGRVEAVGGISLDVTAQKRAEEALRDSERRYRTLFASNPHPMWVYDRQTLSILEVNEAALAHYGYGRDEFLSLTIKDLRPPEDVPNLLAHLNHKPDGLTPPTLWRHRKKDGTIIEVEIWAHDLPFSGRSARLVLAHDVTEQRRMEERLRQAQKLEAVGRLAGGVAHDFNNLLTVITGYAILLRETLGPVGPWMEHLAEIERAAGRAARLVQQLLAYGRKQFLAPRMLNVTDFLNETRSLIQQLVGEKVKVDVRSGENANQVWADPDQLREALVNLATNAREAMPEGGRLTLATSPAHLDQTHPRLHPELRPGHYVLLEVQDTGQGMAPEVLSCLFEPFFTTKEFGSGSGLGMATVYGIIKQSGGHVEVASQTGKGTTFRLYLPTEEGQGAPVPGESASSARTDASRTPRQDLQPNSERNTDLVQ
jgi:PAS domain S-box-containing protein